MLFSTKILISLLCLMFFTHSSFSMDGDIEEGKQSHSVEMISVNNAQQSRFTSELVEQASQLSAVNRFSLPMNQTLRTYNHDIEEKSNYDGSDTKTDEGKSSSSIDTVILGNLNSTFANPMLEYCAKVSATCWGFLYSWLGDLDSISHAAETALTACTQFADNEHIAIYVIEATMIADTLHQLYSLSQKIAPIREKQARMYEAQNKLNALRDQDPNHQLLINGKDVAENPDFYASKSMARWYNFCATYRNIAWDQVGVLAILCRVCANSIVAFSLGTDPKKCKTLLLAATLLRFGGTFCYLYAKGLPKSTKEMEKKAMDSASYIEYMKRSKNNASTAAANGGVLDV